MKKFLNQFKQSNIPTWINILQILLIAIQVQQAYQFYFDMNAISESGINTQGIANQNLIFEFAARTLTMAVVSILIVLSQDTKLYIVMFIMNILREGQETIIDPMYPLLNAPVTPKTDLILHLVIVGIEFIALLSLVKIFRKS